jgi:hypothetical protein
MDTCYIKRLIKQLSVLEIGNANICLSKSNEIWDYMHYLN